MNFNSRAAKISAIAFSLSALLSACGEQGNWVALYEDGLKAQKAGDLDKASSKYKASMTDAFQHSINDKLYAHVILQEANLLLSQGKDEEAIPYLVRTLQLGSATHMGLEENIRLLHTLARAEAKAQDWQEAAGTEKTLITLLEVEKSPYTPQLVEERRFNEEIKANLISSGKDRSHISSSRELKISEPAAIGNMD